MSALEIEQVRAKRNTDPMTFDPSGFFVIFVDKRKHDIVVEHYLNVEKEDSNVKVATGKLNKVIRGTKALEIRDAILELDLVSRLDHMGYLGVELARAEIALITGGDYEQDS